MSQVETGSTPDGPQLLVHDAQWSVLTSDDDVVGGISLRVVGHGESLADGDGLRLIFDPDLVVAAWRQLVEEIMPYATELGEHRD